MWKGIAAAAAGGAIGTIGGALLGRHLSRKEFTANAKKAIGEELESCGFDKEAIAAAGKLWEDHKKALVKAAREGDVDGLEDLKAKLASAMAEVDAAAEKAKAEAEKAEKAKGEKAEKAKGDDKKS